MSNTYIKDGGIQRLVQIPWVKTGGAWQKLKKIWVKDSGVWRQVFGNTGSQTFTSLGNTNWTPPPGVYSVNVTYPAVNIGLVTTTIECTPGVPIGINIGDYGSTSTFGSVTMPVFDAIVFRWSGNVDNDLGQNVSIATNEPRSYSGYGYAGTLTAGAAANGITYQEFGEGWHGDLPCSIEIYPVLISTLQNTFECYFSSHGGREARNSISQQPSAGNGYILQTLEHDYSRSEGTYSNTLNIRQKGWFSITY